MDVYYLQILATIAIIIANVTTYVLSCIITSYT